MRLLYRILNAIFLLLGVVLCTFCSNATLGSPEALRRAAETEPYTIFFVRTAAVLLAVLAYAGLVSVLNHTVFRRVAQPAKIFWASLVVYFLVTVVCVYLFIRTSLVLPTPS